MRCKLERTAPSYPQTDSSEAVNTSFIVVELTRLRIEHKATVLAKNTVFA